LVLKKLADEFWSMTQPKKFSFGHNIRERWEKISKQVVGEKNVSLVMYTNERTTIVHTRVTGTRK
jgi:hypothetical protein